MIYSTHARNACRDLDRRQQVAAAEHTVVEFGNAVGNVDRRQCDTVAKCIRTDRFRSNRKFDRRQFLTVIERILTDVKRYAFCRRFFPFHYGNGQEYYFFKVDTTVERIFADFGYLMPDRNLGKTRLAFKYVRTDNLNLFRNYVFAFFCRRIVQKLRFIFTKYNAVDVHEVCIFFMNVYVLQAFRTEDTRDLQCRSVFTDIKVLYVIFCRSRQRRTKRRVCNGRRTAYFYTYRYELGVATKRHRRKMCKVAGKGNFRQRGTAKECLFVDRESKIALLTHKGYAGNTRRRERACADFRNTLRDNEFGKVFKCIERRVADDCRCVLRKRQFRDARAALECLRTNYFYGCRDIKLRQCGTRIECLFADFKP